MDSVFNNIPTGKLPHESWVRADERAKMAASRAAKAASRAAEKAEKQRKKHRVSVEKQWKKHRVSVEKQLFGLKKQLFAILERHLSICPVQAAVVAHVAIRARFARHVVRVNNHTTATCSSLITPGFPH